MTDTNWTPTSNLHPLELKAMEEFRRRYPDALPWQELDQSTRDMWIAHVEKESK